MKAPQLTRREWEAVRNALHATLAGPLDGFDEGSREETVEFAARRRALAKIEAGPVTCTVLVPAPPAGWRSRPCGRPAKYEVQVFAGPGKPKRIKEVCGIHKRVHDRSRLVDLSFAEHEFPSPPPTF